MAARWIKPLFIVAALYDGLLALAFLFFSGTIFTHFDIEPPNHPAYVHFPALLLLIFAAMFFRIAGNPASNRDLILYGIALKVAYSGTAFWYQLAGGIPFIWVAWAWADIAFLVLFVIAWKSLAQTGTASRG